MSAELNQRVGMAIDGSATALYPGGVYRLDIELHLLPDSQRVQFSARKKVADRAVQSVQFESSAEQGLAVLSAVDAALTAVQEIHLKEQWTARSVLTLAEDGQFMKEERMAADSPVQTLYVHLGSNQLSAGTDARIELADHESDLLCAFACAPGGWLSVQSINGVFAWRGRQVQRHILELRLWRLRRKIKALGVIEAGLDFACDKGYQMRLPICVVEDIDSTPQVSDNLAAPLVLYEQSMRLQYEGRWVDVQSHEMALLAAMARAASHRLTYPEVFGIYGWPDDLQHRKAAEVRLVRLRKKIVELGVALPAIKAVRKVGYQLCFAIQLVEASGA